MSGWCRAWVAMAKGKRKNPVKGKTLSVPQQLSWQVQSQHGPEVGHQGCARYEARRLSWFLISSPQPQSMGSYLLSKMRSTLWMEKNGETQAQRHPNILPEVTQLDRTSQTQELSMPVYLSKPTGHKFCTTLSYPCKTGTSLVG